MSAEVERVLAEWLRDWRLTECEHNVSSIDRELCCAPCLRDRILASDWLAAQIAAAEQRGREDERERIAAAIEVVRNKHWQRHLKDHPLANGKSCPGDYAKHDAYHQAARIARESGA